ncbi:MAG TPA: cobalt ECF transporter T component CbiQ [Bacteroidales bacterium]|mgnify:CR=1 FL=1|nr:cobalt ECF transporter T component CbiQ [Bacteroidales bacterium]HOS72480.1 cobalt ECF transporter T component CbiQ [Bacteroidales bacterium]HQH23026.1 cobalt ECF transporter T component CbiQ [Bacteroidales bacterium]
MRHDLADRYSHLDSPVHRLDPRIKIIAALAGILIIVSEPRYGEPIPFLFYSSVVIIVAAFSKVPPVYILKRLLIVSPFILMAAFFYPLSVYLSKSEFFLENRQIIISAGLTILFKSFLSVIILIILGSTEKLHRLLHALRKLKMPSLITTISALLYRYVFLIADEALKTSRARESRTPGHIRTGRIKAMGNQVAVIFLRSWERSQFIYKSMLSRGFKGEFPDMEISRLGLTDIVFSGLFIILLLLIRIFL